MNIKITNHRVLRFFGYYALRPDLPASVEHGIGMWLRCLWWTWMRR